MTDEEWAVALEVFRACRPRRGDKGRDDRKFLEAQHYFTVHNMSWQALPAEFGFWNSIWKRFWRRRQVGVFGLFLETLASLDRTAIWCGCSMPPWCAHVSAAGARGGRQGQAPGRSRGGFSTSIHLKSDFDGHRLAFHLTGGEVGDSPLFKLLLDLGRGCHPA